MPFGASGVLLVSGSVGCKFNVSSRNIKSDAIQKFQVGKCFSDTIGILIMNNQSKCLISDKLTQNSKK